MEKIFEWLGTHWGEILAFVLVGAAAWHLIARYLFKNRKTSGGACCKAGCGALQKKNPVDNPPA